MTFSEKNWLIITSGFAPVYTKADFNSPCTTDAVYGESCQVLDQENTWFNVKCEDGYTGWIKSFYGSISAEKNKPTHVMAFPDKNGQFKPYCPFGSKVTENLPGSIQITERLGMDQIIPVAKNLLGIPYRWGGKTSMGFDCSGLVQSVLNVCGFHVPRDSYQQRNFFQDYEIQLNETEPGDLHFFGKGGQVTHVGFSTGGAGLLHTQGSVKKESLDLDAADVNKKLLDIYLSSHSIHRKFHP